MNVETASLRLRELFGTRKIPAENAKVTETDGA
jgi:hypothetical protein